MFTTCPLERCFEKYSGILVKYVRTQELMEKCDVNKDGTIDIEEFRRALTHNL